MRFGGRRKDAKKGITMKRMRLYTAGLVAFLVGMPFASTIFAQDLFLDEFDSVGGSSGEFIDALIGVSSSS